MRPRAPVLLNGAASALGRLAGVQSDAYAANDLRMLAYTAMLLAQDYDRGPAWRTEEIDAISDLLRRGAAIAPAPLANGVRAAAEASDAKAGTLRMNVLDERLDLVRGALIDLHAWLEEADAEGAATLLADVWCELRASVKRRSA